MKLSFLRPSLLLALAVALTACGGKATFDVQGTITGLVYSGLVITNRANSDTVTVPAGATTFKLSKSIEYGTEYDVAVTTTALHQDCSIGNGVNPGNGKDTAGRLASINIIVTCRLNAFSIGGAVSGLSADGLVLVNGSGDQVAVAKAATAFNFPTAVAFDSTFGITVLKQPTGLTCRVANGVGKMGDAAVTNVNVSCVANLGG